MQTVAHRTAQAVEYEAPEVRDYGTLFELTAGQQNGNVIDRSFPANTPKQDLTFSQ
jgi:hypothetical protein